MDALGDVWFKVCGAVIDQRGSRFDPGVVEVEGFAGKDAKHVEGIALVVDAVNARTNLIHGVAALDFGREGLEGIDVEADSGAGLGNQVANRNDAFAATAGDAENQIVLG